jgi:hypothetical protein
VLSARIGSRIGTRVGAAFGVGEDPIAAFGSSGPITGVMISGQSNANHRGNTTALDPGLNGIVAYPAITFEGVDTFTYPPATYPRASLAPVGPGVTGMGLEISLGRFVIDALLSGTGTPFSKMAIDGSLIATWRNATNLGNYNAFWNAQEAATGRTISDLVWVQGEADAINAGLSGVYLSELTALMASIVAAHPGLKRIYIIRLNASATGAAITPADRAVVRAAQASWVASNPGLGYLVDVDGIPLDPADNVHYVSNGYWAMGQYIGMAMLGACGMVLPTEQAGTNPYIRSRFRMPMVHSSVVGDAAFKVVPTVANVGDYQYIMLAPNVQTVAVAVVAAEGFVKVGLTVDSNAGGAHIINEVYERQYNGTQGSPIFDTGVGQNRRGAMGFTTHRGGAADANTDHVTAANVFPMAAAAVTTSVDRSLVVFCHAGYSGTDSTLSAVAAAGLSNVTTFQESRIANSCKLTIVSGTDDVAGSSGTCTGTHSVVTNQADKTLSIPPA